ncbi:MAG: glycosyltransferase [Thermomicrobiales bacterium]
MDLSRPPPLPPDPRHLRPPLRATTRVIVNSETGRRYHQQLGYHPREWAFIPNGINLDEFSPNPAHRAAVRAELGLAPDTPLIGLIARRDPMKDHATFFQAAALLSRDHPDAHFLLAGRGITPSDPTLARLLAATGLTGRARLLGERRDIPRLTAALDLATSSSAYGEGFPNVIGEAMACAVPCAATAVGDSAQLIGDTGPIVPRATPPPFRHRLVYPRPPRSTAPSATAPASAHRRPLRPPHHHPTATNISTPACWQRPPTPQSRRPRRGR